ncbi:hypothetical protein [Pseudonocardia sp. TMWB2A]|uniref:hypothetical protein n=1 Tax=Pseudonocardia sp. TMWB2A TaxID=687430 RepID=UPI00307F3448
MIKRKNVMANKVTENFDRLRERAADALDTASSSARETAEAARARVATTYGNARDTSERLIEQGREKAGEAYVVGKEKAEEAYRVGKDKATHAYGVTKVEAGKLADKTVEQINDKPLAAVVGAFAVGAIAAFLIPKGNRRDRDA